MFVRYFVILSVLFAVNAKAETSMSVVLDEQHIQQCRPQMLSLAEAVIGKKEHRLHLEQPKRNADKYPFSRQWWL